MSVTLHQNWLHPQHHHFFCDTQEASQWLPQVDVREEDSRYVILADVPGIEPKDIEISMDKGVLSVRGERKVEAVGDSAKATRVERRHGAFERRFALPEGADMDAITASGKHGVLEIAIPKKAQAAPRKIVVAH